MPSTPTAPLKETQVYNHPKYNGQWCTRGKAKGKERLWKQPNFQIFLEGYLPH